MTQVIRTFASTSAWTCGRLLATQSTDDFAL